MEHHDEIVESKLFEMYDEIQLGSSEICQNCKNNTHGLSLPVPFWFVGKKFSENDEKLLFVGKNARGNPGEIIENYLDCRKNAEELWNGSYAYWSYIRNITEHIFGNDLMDNIAFTNIVKCNSSVTVDTTSDLIKSNCIKDLQVLRKEIKLIEPKKIIFLTSWDYDGYMKYIFDEIEEGINTEIKIGKKTMPWWGFKGKLNKTNIEVLRIGHPERKNKKDYVNAVVNWINKIHNFDEKKPH